MDFATIMGSESDRHMLVNSRVAENSINSDSAGRSPKFLSGVCIIECQMWRKDRKLWIRDIAAERIVRLFDLAEESFDNDSGLSKRYVFLARKIGMRHRVGLPPHRKRKVCKRCGTYLVPGASCT